MPARSDLGTDLDIQDYKRLKKISLQRNLGIKRCDEAIKRTINLVKCQKEVNCHDGTR